MDNITNPRIRAIQKQIEDLKARWPAHSTPPALMAQLDKLEEALEEEITKEVKRNTEQHGNKVSGKQENPE